MRCRLHIRHERLYRADDDYLHDEHDKHDDDLDDFDHFHEHDDDHHHAAVRIERLRFDQSPAELYDGRRLSRQSVCRVQSLFLLDMRDECRLRDGAGL